MRQDIGFDERLERTQIELAHWCKSRGYKGWNKHDALNSPILSRVLGWSKWTRIAAVQLVTRSPINLRPLLCIPHTYNPKGLSLLARAYLQRYALTTEEEWRQEAEGLLSLLVDLRAGREGWGYAYPWQDLGFYAPAHMPNAVVSSFVCEAYLDAHSLLGEERYLEQVESTIEFFVYRLRALKDTREELCLSYMPLLMSMRVLDVSILIGSVLARYAAVRQNEALKHVARRLAQYVVRRQTDEGAWYYTDPPQDSPITHDNYHTGFILDALWRYMSASDDWSFRRAYEKGLVFYHDYLFTADGAPRWMSNREYPYDIHGAAQGILTFAREGRRYPGFAERIAIWTLDNMYHPEGRFFYQKTRWFTKKFTLMRWCNAWMAYALAFLSVQRNIHDA